MEECLRGGREEIPRGEDAPGGGFGGSLEGVGRKIVRGRGVSGARAWLGQVVEEVAERVIYSR